MGLLDAILTYRGYAGLYRELKAAEERDDRKTCDDSRFDLIWDIKFELLRARNQGRRQE